MNKSSIEWLARGGEQGLTWNPVTGCSKVSDGCKNCYAEGVANRFWGDRKFTDVICHEDRLDQPLRRKKGARIFVNSMSDLFHEKVPFEFIDKVLAVVALCPQHTFKVLTKRPERMAEYFTQTFITGGAVYERRIEKLMKFETDQPNWVKLPGGRTFTNAPVNDFPLHNLWLGVSVEDQGTADRRIPKFLDVPAAIRFVSYEPALGPVDFTNIVYPKFKPTHPHDPIISYDVLRGHMKGPDDVGLPKLDWIIAGGESGPGARPSHPDWFRQVRDQCEEAGVPLFFKQWGEWATKEQICVPIIPSNYQNGYWHDGRIRIKIGKKAAGNELDGKQYFQFPEVPR